MLAPRLVADMADCYPGSVHVREVGLREGTDQQVWQHAAEHGLAIVTKDSDFRQLSFLRGHPPKVIWLATGNCSTRHIESLLRSNAVRVAAFDDSEDDAFLVLR